MATLGNAITLAALTHQHQTDRGGKPYILHPMRVMMRLRTEDHELMSIDILHDAVEDSEGAVTFQTLTEMGFSQRVIDGVAALTKHEGESYDDFIKRCALNPDAKQIKMEDIKDNSDVTRLKGLRQKDFERLEKYCKAYDYLKNS